MLDNHRIVIRERAYLEVLDLSLRLIRAYAAELAVAFLVGIGPMMILNAWLLGGFVEYDVETEVPVAYLWWMLILVIWEIPLATAPATLFLGQALFSDRPQPRQIAANLAGSLPQLILYQVLVRGLLVLPLVTWLLLFARRPYSNEVILLERNRLIAGRKTEMTTRRRSSALHRGLEGQFLFHWLGSLEVGLSLFFSFWLSMWFLAAILLNDWAWTGAVYTLYYPLALWLVVAFFTVVRFLGYLDLRIRREGWEVELLMRAEQARWTRQSI